MSFVFTILFWAFLVAGFYFGREIVVKNMKDSPSFWEKEGRGVLGGLAGIGIALLTTAFIEASVNRISSNETIKETKIISPIEKRCDGEHIFLKTTINRNKYEYEEKLGEGVFEKDTVWNQRKVTIKRVRKDSASFQPKILTIKERNTRRGIWKYLAPANERINDIQIHLPAHTGIKITSR